MVWMDRAASRWLLFAAVFAAWCAGSVWAVLETTRPYPGIISMKPGRGAFELSEAALHMPAGRALACLFLLAFLVVAIVGGLRRLLDPDRFAIDAVFWVLRSKTLWLVLGFATALALSAFWVPMAWWDGVVGGIAIVVLVAGLMIPFAAWNARTLQRDALSGWWRLRWPGWQAAVLALGMWAMWTVFEVAVSLFPQVTDASAILIAANLADEVMPFFAWLFVAIVWIERATIEYGWRSLIGILRWRRLRTLLWQWLLFVVGIGGLLVPVLMAVVLAIYVFPQYEEFAKEDGQALSWSLRALWQMSHRFQELVLLPAVVVMLMACLAQGRLLVSLGIGDRSESP
jgi:hypothetical protein